MTDHGVPGDWVADVADAVAAVAAERGHERITCASGISPSGPIHLGNLREVMVPHLVADELQRRGLDCRHLLSWDDYDRLRKVPAGVDPSFQEHIGRPLTAVPDPEGCHESWSEHFKAPFRVALHQLVVHDRDLPGRPAEADEAELQPVRERLPEADGGGRLRRNRRGRAHEPLPRCASTHQA